MNVFVRGTYNYDVDLASDEAGLVCLDKSLAQQSQKEEADINTIVQRFGITGMLPQNVRPPLQEDFVDIVDFHSAQNAIMAARDSFMRMPAGVRARFDNDPGAFVAFCSDEANIDEMRKLGLAVPRTAQGNDSLSAPDGAGVAGAGKSGGSGETGKA